MESLFTPYTGSAAALGSTPFATSGCPSPLPFSLAQSTQSSIAQRRRVHLLHVQPHARGRTAVPVAVQTTLPAGPGRGDPVGPAVRRTAGAGRGRARPRAKSARRRSTVGAGSEPYPFSGPVYLTGPYDGAPYGLSIPVRGAGRPVQPRHGRHARGDRRRPVQRPRDRHQLAADDRQGRAAAPEEPQRRGRRARTSCSTRPTAVRCATESTLTSTFGATQNVSSPFQVSNCGALAFKPSFKASTSAKTSKLERGEPAGQASPSRRIRRTSSRCSCSCPCSCPRG